MRAPALTSWLAALVAAGGTIGCGDDPVPTAAARPPALGPALPVSDPGARGPYAVGVTTLETTDGQTPSRTLPVEVWYPALPADGAPAAVYELSVGPLLLASAPSPGGAVRDAPADLRGAPHPVVVFSHGFGGVRFQSVYLTEHLASHGFVVVAPDHAGNTFQSLIATATALPAVESARLRPIDTARALDLLLERSAEWPGLLAFTADPSRVGVAGHSFGGFTSLRVAGGRIDVGAATASCQASPDDLFCDGWRGVDFPPSQRDDRFIAALAQAPGGTAIFAGGGLGDVAVPTMLQGGTLDETTPFEIEQVGPFQQIPSPAWLLGVLGAGHFTYSDMCALVQLLGLTNEAFDDGCGEANVPSEVAHPIIVRYSTAFLQLHVAGRSEHAGVLEPGADPPEGVASFESK